MLCPNCEAENRDGAKFCDECGFPLTGAIARAAGGASPIGSDRDLAFDEEEFAEVEHPALHEEETPIDMPADKPVDKPAERPVDVPANDPRVFDFAGLDVEGDFIKDDEPEFDRMPKTAPVKRPESVSVQSDSETKQIPVNEPATMPLKQPSGPQEPVIDPFADIDPNYDPWSYERSFTPADDYEVNNVYDGSYATADYGESTIKRPGSQKVWPSDVTMQMPRINKDEPVESRDFMASATKKQKGGSKRVILIIVAVLLVIGAALGVTYALGVWGGKAVPNVIGMTENDARSVLEENGFTVRSTQVKSDDTEGLVLVMDPGAGARANEGSEIVIHVATARFVPDVVGKTQAEAEALFKDSGYENVKVEKQRSNDTEGIVLSVKPDAGTRAKSSMEVIMTVSEAYRVPDITNMSLNEAESAITDAGLRYSVTYVDTNEYPDGTVLGTDPEAGTKVNEGDTVKINVSRQRGIELEGLTRDLLTPGNTVSVGGYDYDIESVDSVTYMGDDVVAFKATGKPKITFFGETLYASSSQSIEGKVVWSADNKVVSIS